MTDKSHRSAITGKYVTAEHAAANPDTTVSESRTRRPAGDYSDLRALVAIYLTAELLAQVADASVVLETAA